MKISPLVAFSFVAFLAAALVISALFLALFSLQVSLKAGGLEEQQQTTLLNNGTIIHSESNRILIVVQKPPLNFFYNSTIKIDKASLELYYVDTRENPFTPDGSLFQIGLESTENYTLAIVAVTLFLHNATSETSMSEPVLLSFPSENGLVFPDSVATFSSTMPENLGNANASLPYNELGNYSCTVSFHVLSEYAPNSYYDFGVYFVSSNVTVQRFLF